MKLTLEQKARMEGMSREGEIYETPNKKIYRIIDVHKIPKTENLPENYKIEIQYDDGKTEETTTREHFDDIFIK